MIVADNNLVVYLLAGGPHVAQTRAVLRQDRDWMVPPLWRSEFLNALLGYLRRGMLSEEGAMHYVREAAAVVRTTESPPAEAVLHLAVQHGLSAYDATYAALALELHVPHLTYDRQVLRAGLGIHPTEFLG